VVSRKEAAGLAVLLVAVGAGVGAAYALKKGTGGGGMNFLCTALTSSGVVMALPAGSSSNGSVLVSYALNLGAACAAPGEYLYISPADAASLGVQSGYWFISAGGSGGLTLSVSPGTVSPGGTLSFTGTGFTPNGRVEVNASGQGFFQVYAVIIASATGGVSSSILVPTNAGAGPASLSLGDEGTSQVVSAQFAVA
jgi:hypothetical protein